MKTLLIFMACCCLLIACRKNCDRNELVGSWKLIADSRGGQLWQPIHASEELTLSFHNNNSFTQVRSLLSSTADCNMGTYKITNDTLVMRFSCPSFPSYEVELGFTINGNTLILDHYATATSIKTKYIRQ